MDGLVPAECPSYMIDLSDLFPFLKVNQLPLYMISEPINVELTFHPTAATHNPRLQISSTDETDKPVNIVRDQLKFCADYIFYGATDEMERYAAANRNMNFSFVDYRLVEHSTSQAALASNVIRNLGMANRLVPRVISLIVNSTPGTDAEELTLGTNNSQSPQVPATGVADQSLRYNIRYNDRFEFTSDVDNISRLFSIFQQSEGVPFITRQEFSDMAVNGNFTTKTYMTRQQAAQLEGNFFNLSTRLTKPIVTGKP